MWIILCGGFSIFLWETELFDSQTACIVSNLSIKLVIYYYE